MGWPATGAFDSAETEGDFFPALEDFLAAAKQLPGGQPETELTIATGAVTATRAIHTIDTESDAASDDLTNIDVAGLEDGMLVLVGAENVARVVTLKHASGGAGQMTLAGAKDVVLDAPSKRVLFYVDKSSTAVLVELARFGFDQAHVLEANTAGSGSPNILTADEADKVLTNEGSTAKNYHTLPAARAGLRSPIFVVQDADGLRVTAGAGDTIRIEANATPAAGYVESTTIGSVVQLVAINDTEWVAIAALGTWTVSS